MCGVDDDAELVVKTSSDCWVVGKRCDKREVYVVVSHKNANLIEINGMKYLVFCSIHCASVIKWQCCFSGFSCLCLIQLHIVYCLVCVCSCL